MATRPVNSPPDVSQHNDLQSQMRLNLPLEMQHRGGNEDCDITAVEKRRDGGTRYWCRTHRADATAKYGKPAQECRAAKCAVMGAEDLLVLDLDKYHGGVALWGAVPAVYDTTRLPMDRGIHVHARPEPGSKKEMDWTYRAVRIVGGALPEGGAEVNEIDAVYYMVSSVFQFEMIQVFCTHCEWPHLDKDWFSVHPHRRHLCAGCGRHFHDSRRGIGNPIIGVREACGFTKHKVKSAARALSIKQSQYPGGLQIWGSNPAFLWTSLQAEEEGIHVHAYMEGQSEPVIDDTFSEVTVDEVVLEPTMVRYLMAQSVMPSLKDRIRSIACTNCGHFQFDLGEDAFMPSGKRTCAKCGNSVVATGRFRNVVSNPLPAILESLARHAPRIPQRHRLDLLPETL